MGHYRSNTTKQQDSNFAKRETVEEFLARGGQVTKVSENQSGKKRSTKNKKGIDAQALLDAAVGTKDEAKVIAFLKSQGIEVEG